MLGARSLGTHGLGDSTDTTRSGYEVATTLSLLWNVRQTLTDSLALQWGVRTTASDDLALVWSTRALAADNLGLVWDTRALLTGTLELPWQVLARVFAEGEGKELELVWRVFKNLEDAERLPYYKVGPRHARILVRGNQ